jgi:hypothetical protein
MSLLSKITGRVRGLFAGNYAENDENTQFVMNNRGDQCMVQALPPYAELVRMGGSWMAKTSTAFAALTTEPTTAGALSIVNANPSGGPSIVIDSIFHWQRVTDATQQDYTAVFHMLNKTSDAVATGTDVTANLKSLSGRSNYGGKAKVLAASTVVDNGWSTVGNPTPFATGFAGALWRTGDIKIDGLYIVPPGATYSIHFVELAAAASQMQAGIRFHEAQLIIIP